MSHKIAREILLNAIEKLQREATEVQRNAELCEKQAKDKRNEVGEITVRIHAIKESINALVIGNLTMASATGTDEEGE